MGSSSTRKKKQVSKATPLPSTQSSSKILSNESRSFVLDTEKSPKGGQPEAIKKLVAGYGKFPCQTLLGITGSGKTFMIANVVEQIQKPTLLIAHNKTLAAQLYQELKLLFPHNRVEYFVSYYDYYQPESYIPTTDTFIEKDASVNEKIERMRLRATASLLSRKDTIIVSSISCIYGLGDPKDFAGMSLSLETGKEIDRQKLIVTLLDMQYERNDLSVESGKFRVRGDVIDVMPGYEETIIRIELFDNEIDSVKEIDPVTGNTLGSYDDFILFPAKHFVIPEERMKRVIGDIEEELEEHLPKLDILEATRLKKRVNYDIEMMQEMGYCNGIENYSRHFENRKTGEPAKCLLDYFPDDFLLVIDESHQTIPQSHAMYKGDFARKKNLVEHGFRLPCAFDNRPLKFPEFEQFFRNTIFVSATPGDYEKKKSGQLVECIIRPTGLLDPEVEMRPTKNQIDDLIGEINTTVEKGDRVLVTTLTKKMAERLTDYLARANIKVRYLHSDIDTIERTEIIRQLRAKEFDVLVGINLLREGLDIPEVSLVAILDADKEGFLRNERSLLQTIGRAARNDKGRVILYADKKTDSIKKAMAVTANRRQEQIAFNNKHGIVPQTIMKAIPDKEVEIKTTKHIPKSDIPNHIVALEAKMNEAAENLDFEAAIDFRNQIKKLQKDLERGD